MTIQTFASRRERSALEHRRACRRLGVLTALAAAYTYALVVFGGIVRITGSGMGCGDDWPRCNGQWIPEFTLATLIEYTHRLLGAGIGVVVLAVFAYALVHRNSPGVAGRGGALRPLGVGAILLAVQIVLGAVTVRLELPTSITVAHFVTAMLFMATLIAAAIRGTGVQRWNDRQRAAMHPAPDLSPLGGGASERPRGDESQGTGDHPRTDLHPPGGGYTHRTWRMAVAAAVLGLLVISLGALTANTPVAPQACRGFPLCSGELFPANPPAHVQWTHRVLAFLLLFHVAAAAWSGTRRRVAAGVRNAAYAALGLVIVQFAIAAALVTLPLPRELQVAHLAVGVAVWAALVAWVEIAREPRETRGHALLDQRRTPA